MSQQRMVGGNYELMNVDTTYTKLFVGGLAWETQRDTMKKYFEQFGEILEAVVITDKATGRSKGYGFVTFKDPEAAFRACQNPSPVIDGRRANCNLASFGAQKKPPPTSQPVSGPGRFRSPAPGLITPPYPGSSSSTHLHQSYGQPPLAYSAYGYTGYSHEAMYNMNYYGMYGQQFSPYYSTTGAAGAGAGAAASGSMGYFHNLYPYYAPYPQSSQAHGFGVQYPHQMVQQYPFLPQHFSSSSGVLSLPSSTMAITNTTTGLTATVGALAGPGSAPPPQTKTTDAASEQNSSA